MEMAPIGIIVQIIPLAMPYQYHVHQVVSSFKARYLLPSTKKLNLGVRAVSRASIRAKSDFRENPYVHEEFSHHGQIVNDFRFPSNRPRI